MRQTQEELAAGLRVATGRLWRRMRQESGNELVLTPSRASALSAVQANGPIRMTDLAKIERVNKSSVTRLVGRLTELGLVELIEDAEDGRSTLVEITPHGERVLESSSKETDAFVVRRLDSLSEAEQTILAAATSLLERLADAEGDR